MTVEKRKQAQKLLDEADPVSVVARLLIVQEALRAQLATANAEADKNAVAHLRPVQLARLTDFAIDAADGNRTEAARCILRCIDPELQGPFPTDLEKLARVAGKVYSDLGSSDISVGR